MELLNILTENKQVAILISLIGTLYWLWQKIRTELNEKKKEFMEKILTTQPSVDSFKDEIEQKLTHSPNLYREELSSVLDFLERHLEPLRLFSMKAFEKHLSFSFIYSFSFFYLVWLFGGDGKVGMHQLMPSDNQLSIVIYSIFEIIIFFLFTFYTKNLVKLIQNIFPANKHILSIVVYTQVIFMMILIGILIMKNVLNTIPLVGILLISMAFILLKDNKNIKIGIVLLIGTGIILAITLLSLIYEIINNLFILNILFIFILPFINAIFDYLSMIASRFFAQKILQTHKKMTIFWDILWDLLIALALFVGLALTLFYLLDFINHAFIKEEALFVPIEHYKSLLLSGQIFHPDVLWITLMFASTLIPTLIHLYLFVYSLMAFMLVQPHLHHVVEALDKLDLENHHQKELVAYDLADYRLTNYLRIHIGFMVVLSIGFVVLLGVIISKLNLGAMG